MKIPLHLRRPFGELMPFVFITIGAPRVRPLPIDALVDTGSPWIAITPKDILKLNISIKRLRKATEYVNVSLGGYKFWRYLLGATVRMADENGRIISIDLPSISVLWPTMKKPPEEIKHIPSVLGSDFLTIGRFCLHFDPSKQIAYLGKNF